MTYNYERLCDMPKKEFEAEQHRILESLDNAGREAYVQGLYAYTQQSVHRNIEITRKFMECQSREEMERIALENGIQPHLLREYAKVAAAYPEGKRDYSIPMSVYAETLKLPKHKRQKFLDKWKKENL